MALVQEALGERCQAVEADNSSQRRMVGVVLALATIVAAGLRLPFLGHQSLWLDEIFTREILRESSLSGVWHHIKVTESTPPLYYVVGWLVGTRSTEAMRLISALSLSAAVPVGYLAFRRLIGTRAALATAAILAVSPVLVSYSTDARSYGLFVLMALLSLWAFSVLLEQRSARHFALWVLASAGCVWTHYFGVFVVGAEVLALLVSRPQLRRATVAWTVVLGACLIPLVPLLANQSGDERAEFIAGIPLTKRLSETIRQFAMGPNVPRASLEAVGLLVVVLAAAVGVWMAWRSRSREARALLALTAIVFVAPLLLAVLGIEDRFYARNVIAAVPLMAAFAAPALLRLRAVPLVIYLVLATATSVWVATDWRYEQADWQEALARAEAIDPGAAVVAVTRLGEPVVQTYLARRPTAPSGILARQAWLIVEPVRATGHRDLGPAPAPTLPGFTVQCSTLEVHGFRLILVGASQATRIMPSEISGASVFAAKTHITTRAPNACGLP